jgi:small-conductance mechanosensitive channel
VGAPLDRVVRWLSLDVFVAMAGLGVLAWVLYFVLLRGVSPERHKNLRRRFASFALLLVASFVGVLLVPYVRTSIAAWFVLSASAAALVRLAQVFLYIVLFRTNMRSGVPRLLVNLFTLVLCTTIGAFIAAEVFGIRLAPIFATSAAFSLVLGLALQDTLGNLFSGVALQIEHSFVIGDWIEAHHGAQKWSGQVHEVTWRATFLIGFTGELIAIPNRTLAQSEIVKHAHGQTPMRAHGVFRFRFDVDVEKARTLLTGALTGVEHVLALPAPSVLITEIAESFVVFKVFYSIDDPAARFAVADVFFERVLAAAHAGGLPLATPRMELTQR